MWTHAPSFDIRYGDAALRQTYPSLGKVFAGQYQPEILGNTAIITDPADCTVKYFFRDNSLYLGFDVRDQVVQFSADENLYDGFRVSLNEYSLRESQDHVLQGRRLTRDLELLRFCRHDQGELHRRLSRLSQAGHATELEPRIGAALAEHARCAVTGLTTFVRAAQYRFRITTAGSNDRRRQGGGPQQLAFQRSSKPRHTLSLERPARP